MQNQEPPVNPNAIGFFLTFPALCENPPESLMNRIACCSGPKDFSTRGRARMPSHFESGSIFQTVGMLRGSSFPLISCSTSSTIRLLSDSNRVTRTCTICVASRTKSCSGEVALMTAHTSEVESTSQAINSNRQRVSMFIAGSLSTAGEQVEEAGLQLGAAEVGVQDLGERDDLGGVLLVAELLVCQGQEVLCAEP